MMQYAWSLFSSTTVGKHFIGRSEGFVEHVTAIFSQASPLQFSATIAAEVIAGLLVVAFIAQFLYLRNLLYSPLPLLFKGVWAFLAAIIASPFIMELHDFPSQIVAFAIVLPAALAAVPPCMKLASSFILPVGEMAVKIFSSIMNIFQR
ncbi:MAG: hypothetical protein Q9M20_01290 [Mariprofundaceae bacterium]|nr:hypothetical protein [Mariprofundaceae bacterium]